MKKYLAIVVMAVVMVSCGGNGRSAAYYEQMVDSIRKAEQVEAMQRKAGIAPDKHPLRQWLDSLQWRTLPIRNAGDDLARLGDFEPVPSWVCEHLGYQASDDVRAVAMPSVHDYNVVMMAQMKDSVNAVISLHTIDHDLQPVDWLCLYEKKEKRHRGSRGYTFMEYFVTSNYEVTVMHYFQSLRRERKPELLNMRRYAINSEGLFEELIIEL